MNKTSISNAS